MSRGIEAPVRYASRGFAALLLAALVACGEDGFFAPSAPPITAGMVAVRFQTAGGETGGAAQAFDRAEEARIRLIDGASEPASVVLDTTVALPEPGEERPLEIPVSLSAPEQAFTLRIDLLADRTVLFSSETPVVLRLAETVTVEPVLQPVPAAIELPQQFAPITAIGNTVTLTGSVLFASGDVIEGAPLQWESLDPEVLEVDPAGTARAIREGIATVAARHGELVATATVEVRAIEASIEVTPPALELTVGSSELLQVIVRDANGNPLARTPTFRSFSPSIADVDEEGRVTARALGEASIAVQSGNAPTVLVPVTVGLVPVEILDLTPPESEVLVGATVALTATPRDGQGNELTGRTVTWASANTLVATVDDAGVVRGVASGVATITAFSEGVSASVVVQVVAPVIGLSPSSVAFQAQQGGPLPEGAVVTIENEGAGQLGDLTVEALYTSGQDWLSLVLEAATDGGNLTIQPNTTELPEGTYTAQVIVRAAAPGATQQAVTVTYEVVPVPIYSLTVQVDDSDGDGSVVSTPAGIRCGIFEQGPQGTDCTEAYEEGTLVVLTAAPTGEFTFQGWGGACQDRGANLVCEVVLDQNLTVTATFGAAPTRDLEVQGAGNGSGTIRSDPAGIDCTYNLDVTADCAEAFVVGTVVTLTAEPGARSTFDGWEGACSGTEECVVTMDAATQVTARFGAIYALRVELAGEGSGSVVSSPAGIDCSIEDGQVTGECSAEFPEGTPIVLTATPTGEFTFQGWGGTCGGTVLECEIQLDTNATVTATFGAIPTRDLQVQGTGNGGGTIRSDPAGIDCAYNLDATADCAEAFAVGTVVTLTAEPADGSTFDGWEGACSGTGECLVTMDAATRVAARFGAIYALRIDLAGGGSGSVVSSPAGLDCSIEDGQATGSCSAEFAEGTLVLLTATPTGEFTFEGWSGACVGTDRECEVQLDADATVTATFGAVPTWDLEVQGAGNGSGTIRSDPAGIDCAYNLDATADCAEAFAVGTVVTLTAEPGEASSFDGWEGACSGTDECVVTMDAATQVSARFGAIYALQIELAGEGSGSVVSSPVGIDCSIEDGQVTGACSAEFREGTPIVLTATPSGEFTFQGWGGTCGGTVLECEIQLDTDATVTATFGAVPTWDLEVQGAGNGGGTIRSDPAGIDCAYNLDATTDCVGAFVVGTVVTLTAEPADGSSFDGWEGACSGTDECVVTMDGATRVTARFGAIYALQIEAVGDGSGTVVSSPSGLACSIQDGQATGSCSAEFPEGTQLTLTAEATSTSNFVRWSEPCAADVRTCTLVLETDMSLSVEFEVDLGRIAFVVDNDFTGAIWIMDGDGSNPRQVTDGSCYVESPAWSPDGREIAYVQACGEGGRNIFVLDPIEGQPRQLTFDGGWEPSWSPDGEQIVFTAPGIYSEDLFVLDLGSGDVRSLTQNGGRSPAWSPDGSTIAYVDPEGFLYLMNADGTNPRIVAVCCVGFPAWSPDGQSIAISTDVSGIYVVDAAGGEPRLVIEGYGQDPTWSPDGRRIAFHDLLASGVERWDIGVVDVEGGTPEQLTLAGGRSPSWQLTPEPAR